MKDINLLNALSDNARLSVTDLKDILNSSEAEVEESIKRLENSNIICGYHTVINWDKTNKDTVTAIIKIGATPKRESGYDDVAAKIYRYPEVTSMYLVSGATEFNVVLEGKTMREVSEFVARKLAPIEGVTKTETHFVLKTYKIEGAVLVEEEIEYTRQIVST